MTTTYNDIVEAQEYDEARREHNLCAQGNGENPFAPYTVRPDWMSEAVWNNYQALAFLDDDALFREIDAVRARHQANAAQVRKWQQEEVPAIHVERPVKPEGMSIEDWNEYQEWIEYQDCLAAQSEPCPWDDPRAYKTHQTQGG